MSENPTKAEIIITQLCEKVKSLHLTNIKIQYEQHLWVGCSDCVQGQFRTDVYDSENVYEFFLHGEANHLLIRYSTEQKFPSQQFLQERMGKFVMDFAEILKLLKREWKMTIEFGIMYRQFPIDIYHTFL